jgi:Lrp/AsnC family leucine-responsive transcriptional regulator
MDRIDLKLIKEMDENSRKSFTQIGKKIGVSKEVTRYRFENLRKKNIIRNTYALINNYKLGAMIFITWIKFHQTTSEVEKEIIENLKKEKGVGVLIDVYGKWDLALGIWSTNIIEYYNKFQEITKKYSKFIKEKLVTTEINCTYLSQKKIYDSEIENTNIGNQIEKSKLDEKDIEIIKILAKNSRVLTTEIAKKLNITATATAKRIRRLEKEKIIAAYKLEINYEKLNLTHYRIFLKINQEDKNKIKEYIKTMPQAISVMNYIGYADVDFRVIVSNTKEYLK